MKIKKVKIKPLCKRTKFTIFSMFNIVWYTVVVLIASFSDHAIPSDLTIAWFSAWTVELALLFGIKMKSKEDENSSMENYEFSEEEISNDDEEQNESVQNEDNVPNHDDDLG